MKNNKLILGLLVIILYWLMAVATSRYPYPRYLHTSGFVELNDDKITIINQDTFDFKDANVYITTKKKGSFRLGENINLAPGEQVTFSLSEFLDYPVKKRRKNKYKLDTVEIQSKEQREDNHNYQYYELVRYAIVIKEISKNP